jgi:hypothetical protein
MTTHVQSVPVRTSSSAAHHHIVISTQGIGKWFAKSPMASFFRTFAAVMLGLAVADWATAAQIGFANWRIWLLGALVAVVPVIARALNLDDTAFGSGKEK